jgi:hypothetical protein
VNYHKDKIGKYVNVGEKQGAHHERKEKKIWSGEDSIR